MFSSNGSVSFSNILDYVPSRVTPDINQTLLGPYTKEEIHEALFQVDHHTALRPDNMSPLFFQQFWDIVGVDVVCTVPLFLSSGCVLRQLNYTLVSFIPKVPKPQNMSQLRPIALCNVLYKIDAKVVVNRLKGIMDWIISDQQGTFVPGRLISDNSVVASKVGHYLHNLGRG